MQYMLVRNRVRDYDVWKTVFDSEQGSAEESGLELAHLWRASDDPNTVYFILCVRDRAKADAFVNDPASAKVGERAGVIDGEITYIEDVE